MSRRLYRHPMSGHCHRVELFLSLLGLDVELIDATGPMRKSAEFLALNPFGQIPVLIDEDGTTLADSNAILVYLAARYDAGGWLPTDPIGRGRVQRWLSVAAGEVAYGPAAARLVTVFGVPLDHEQRLAVARRLFGWLEAHLGDRTWLALDHPTLADVALYSYLAVAPEGGAEVAPHTAICAWMARFEALPGFVPMTRTPVPGVGR